MEIFTIEKKFYDSSTIKTYSTREEWIEKIDSESCEQATAGSGETMTVAIYEAPNDEVNHWSGTVYHPASRDRHAEIDSIPEDWEMIESQEIYYWSVREIWASKDSNTLTYEAERHEEQPEGTILAYYDGNEIYETEEEAIESNNPSQYLYI